MISLTQIKRTQLITTNKNDVCKKLRSVDADLERYLILPIRLEPKNKQAASWDYAPNKSMLQRVKIFKLTINAGCEFSSYRGEARSGQGADVQATRDHRVPRRINLNCIPNKSLLYFIANLFPKKYAAKFD